MRTTKEIGDFYEKLACKHYETQGHNILERNYRYKNSEIDIISAFENFIYFVEVKFRATNKFGNAEEMVSPEQEKRIVDAAEAYILDNNINALIRFDIVVFDNKKEIRVFKDAFG